MSVLLVSVGGTHIVSATAEAGALSFLPRLESSAFRDPREIITALGLARPPRTVLFAVAGMVWDGRGDLATGDMRFDAQALAADLSLEHCAVLNDLVAVAWSLRAQLGDADGRTLILNIGTGYGGAVVTSRPDFAVTATEPGRLSTSALQGLYPAFDFSDAATPRELEDYLSGPGVPAIAARLAVLRGAAPPPSTAEAVFAQAAAGDPVCAETVDRLWRLLGNSAAELALCFAPVSCIFLTGGVIRKNLASFYASGFKGAFADRERASRSRWTGGFDIIAEEGAELRGLAQYAAHQGWLPGPR